MEKKSYKLCSKDYHSITNTYMYVPFEQYISIILISQMYIKCRF